MAVRNEVMREHVIRIRIQNPCLTLQRIGDHVGLTRERVRQILASEDCETKAYKKIKRCFRCDKVFTANKKYCSSECYLKDIAEQREKNNIEVSCSYCGKMTIRYAPQLISVWNSGRQKQCFCSRKCLYDSFRRSK